MRGLKVGAVLLTIWAGLNALVGAGVTAAILAGRPPPVLAMALPEAEVGRMDPRARAAVDALAVLANPMIVALCALVIAVIWKALVAGERWAFWALAGVLGPIQVFGFVSDAHLGNHNLVANLASTALLGTGLVLAGRGVSLAGAGRRQRP